MTTETHASVRDAKMIIGGEQVDALDGQTFEVHNPATGAVIARVPLGGKADVDRAVEAARKAFEGPYGRWTRRQARPDAGQVRRAGQAQQRGAGPDRPRERGQAHQRVARTSRSR